MSPASHGGSESEQRDGPFVTPGPESPGRRCTSRPESEPVLLTNRRGVRVTQAQACRHALVAGAGATAVTMIAVLGGPGMSHGHVSVAATYMNMGVVEWKLGNLQKALDLYHVPEGAGHRDKIPWRSSCAAGRVAPAVRAPPPGGQ